MKRYFLLGTTALLTLAGCEKDFTVSAPYKDITLVYGILDPKDTAHYVRIHKAFLDESKSAIEMSKIPDSSYFPSLAVKLQEYSLSNSLLGETPLDKVDMNLEGIQKEPAANSQGFYSSPNYGYKFKKTLNPGAQYRLVISNPNTGKNDTSQFFRTVNTDTSKGPERFYIPVFTSGKYEIDFAKTTLPGHLFSLNGTKPANTAKFQGKLRFHYVEKNVVDGTKAAKYVEMYVPSTRIGETSYFIETHNRNIYSFLRDAMGLPGANIERYMGGIDVFVYVGGVEMAQYEAITSAQSSGLTGDQIKPHFTNMKSKDALGIIGTKSFRMFEKARISDAAIDSLRLNSVTAPLQIKGRDI